MAPEAKHEGASDKNGEPEVPNKPPTELGSPIEQDRSTTPDSSRNTGEDTPTWDGIFSLDDAANENLQVFEKVLDADRKDVEEIKAKLQSLRRFILRAARR